MGPYKKRWGFNQYMGKESPKENFWASKWKKYMEDKK
jgi:hypothetical protein